MQISVQFRGPLKNQLGKDLFVVEVPFGSTLEDMLLGLLTSEPVIGKLWGSPVEMDRDAFLMRNGIDVGLLEGIKTALEDGDMVQVLPLVHGG